MYIVYVESDMLTNWINEPILLGINVVHLSGLHCIYIYVTVPVKRVLVAHLFKIELLLP